MLVPDGEGGYLKRPHGRWTRDATIGTDADGIRAIWHRHVGELGRAVVCVACEPSGIWVLDDDRDIDPTLGWGDVLSGINTLTLRSCTKARPHYVFRAGADGTRPKEGRWPGGDVKSSGIIFIGDGDPINDAAPIVAPPELLEKLSVSMVKGGGSRREAVSTEEMWDWIVTQETEDLILTGNGPAKFLDTILARFRDAVHDGEHRRQACRTAVWSAVKESASGFYYPGDAYREIRDVYRELREDDRGEKGWTKSRVHDYDLMWAGAIAAVVSGDLDDAIDENRKLAGHGDDELEELMSVWTSITDVDPRQSNEPDPHELPVSAITPEAAEKESPNEIPDPAQPESVSQTQDSPDEITPEDQIPIPAATDAGSSGGGDEPPRAWDLPDDSWEDPFEDEPVGLERMWAVPAAARITPVWTDDEGRPTLPEDSPVWATTHGKLALALSDGAAEVSAIAIVASSLAYAGAHLAGRATHYIGGDAHNPIVWAALVGRSAAARKSMSISMMNGVYYGFPDEPGASSDPELWKPWLPRRIGGVNSGEILIDSFTPPKAVKETSGSESEDDADDDDVGYYNPRAVVVESEIDRVWTVASREGSVLAVVMCSAWDGSTLSVRSRGSGVVEIDAGNYALGLLGAATESRAINALVRNEGHMAYSGLANRHLWFLLPDETADIPLSDGALPWGAIYDYREALELRSVRSTGVPIWGKDIGFTDDAKDLWYEVYPWLKRGSKSAPGELSRESLSRAEAQVRRLALNFALCRPDGESSVSVVDLECALSIWDYCRTSVKYLLSPERAITSDTTSGGRDHEARRAIWGILSDPSQPGWCTTAELATMTRYDRGTLTHHIDRMVRDELVHTGYVFTGRKGRPPHVVASRKRMLSGGLGARSVGEGSGAGERLENVHWH